MNEFYCIKRIFQVLCVLLLTEVGKGRDSSWAPYLMQLPRTYDTLSTFTSFEIKALQVQNRAWMLHILDIYLHELLCGDFVLLLLPIHRWMMLSGLQKRPCQKRDQTGMRLYLSWRTLDWSLSWKRLVHGFGHQQL